MANIYMNNAYSVESARVVRLSDGREFPIPSPVDAPLLKTAEGERPFKFQTDSLPSFSVAFAEKERFFSSLFRAPTWERPFHLETNGEHAGRVFTYVHLNVVGGSGIEGWYYVNVFDQLVWRYALREGFQLEDAVRELNRVYGGENGN